MNPEDFKEAWKMQASNTRLTIDPDLLLKELRGKQRQFATTIFRRDVTEVAAGLVLVPVWICLGVPLAMPWTWYLTVPALVWIAGFILVDRMRHKRQSTAPDETLRQRVEISLTQVEHQIWLLRNVFWWYLLPPGLSILAFIGQCTWETREGGWWTVLCTAVLVSVVFIVFGGVYRLNQRAVRADLEPRRQELDALLKGLQDETPVVSG